MKTELLNVTPAMASEWLARNTGNRPLRHGTVDGLKQAFIRGEYVQTHQGIAFSEEGVLLDGQHRLTAIAELRDGVFPMLVTRGLSDEAFKAMDIGMKRTAADALREEDKRLVELAKLIASLCVHNRSAISPAMLVPIMENVRRPHNALLAFCSKHSKVWSSAPVRLAAVMSIKNGVDVDYVRAVYRALVTGDGSAMPPVASSLYRASVEGRISARDRADMIGRCLVAFNPEKATVGRVQVKDPAAAAASVRALFGWLIEKETPVAPIKKKAAPNGAAKGVMQRHYRTSAAG